MDAAQPLAPAAWVDVFRAAARGDARRLERALDALDGGSIGDVEGLGSPLHAALQSGNDACVDMLIKRGSNLDTRGTGGVTALRLAARLGRDRDCQKLLAAGARPEATGFKALHEAAAYGNLNCLIALLSAGANPDAECKGLGGHTSSVLHVAAERGHVACVRKLIEAGANVHVRDKCGGWTPLLAAATNGHLQVVNALLEAGVGIDARAVDLSGYSVTPLLAAAEFGHVRVCRRLLKLGADKTAKNNDGEDALAVATRRARAAVVRLLTGAGPIAEYDSDADEGRDGDADKAADEHRGFTTAAETGTLLMPTVSQALSRASSAGEDRSEASRSAGRGSNADESLCSMASPGAQRDRTTSTSQDGSDTGADKPEAESDDEELFELFAGCSAAAEAADLEAADGGASGCGDSLDAGMPCLGRSISQSKPAAGCGRAVSPLRACTGGAGRPASGMSGVIERGSRARGSFRP